MASHIIQGDKSIHPLLRKLPGLLFIALMTIGLLQLATFPSVAHMGLGSLTLAMVGGALLSNTLYPRLQRYCDEGVNWSKHHLLRLGIVLYGFRLSLQHIAALGISGLVINALVLTSTFLLACYLGKTLLGFDDKTVYLIGTGSSICGAAAVLATICPFHRRLSAFTLDPPCMKWLRSWRQVTASHPRSKTPR